MPTNPFARRAERAGRSLSGLCAIAALAGCGRSPPHERAAEAAKQDESSAASAQLLAQEWSRDHVPDRYTRQLLDALHDDLTHQRQVLSSIPSRDSLVTQTLAAHDSVAGQLEQLQHAIGSSDKSAAERLARALGAQSQRIDSLAKRLKP
ncbi:MAG TPA: hypothetical protein VH277_11810 [Gemmatimonadaceae bacterium]|nr:hypothetical protein [Gemmatimonadaceae bacterium]